ncbi:adhesive plaque matrix protein-like [Planococcus citri]|uniref:adhesive plaque matrix protein-like n=1 Tax=Planococcus citri TaxID=170843 RepID=UPI0031F9FCF3
MNNLVISSIILCAAVCCDATLFSWGSSEAKETKPTGYLPILQVHKYNGFQINPIQGPPIYLPNEQSESNNVEGQTIQLNQEQIQQLDLINRLATFLPADADLQEMDPSDVLPYVNLVSEDSLEKFKYVVESSKKKEKSKILKIIAFLKSIKEKKLKPFKYVASVGSNLIHKKKNWIFGSETTTTPEPYVETTPSFSYPSPPPYNIPYNPYFTQSIKPNYADIHPRLPLPQYQFPYYQYPTYPYNQQQKNPSQNAPTLPSADQFPPSYPAIPSQSKPIETPSAEPAILHKLPESNPTPAAIPQYPKFSNSFQFPANFPYPSLPAQNPQPAKSEVTYEYKQPPASTFAVQDTNTDNRQVLTFNQPELSSTQAPAPKAEQSNQQQQYSYQISPASTVYSPPQQPSFALPAYQQPNSWYIPPSYQNPHQEPNKFYGTSSNDLTASGSENVEKIAQPVKPASSQNDVAESSKLNNAVTSTETAVSKPRTRLRPVQVPTRSTTIVYPSLSKEETTKDDVNKSSPANAPTTN